MCILLVKSKNKITCVHASNTKIENILTENHIFFIVLTSIVIHFLIEYVYWQGFAGDGANTTVIERDSDQPPKLENIENQNSDNNSCCMGE